MKVSVGQVYIKPGVSLPFSTRMQVWLSQELTAAASDSAEFEKKYGAGFKLIVRVSADKHMSDNRIKGPTIFKKTKDVEFTVFLPFDVIVAAEEGCRVAVEYLLSGIRWVFEQTGIDPEMLDGKKEFIIERLCSDPTMLTRPWSQELSSAEE
jgi:hypothetical protein